MDDPESLQNGLFHKSDLIKEKKDKEKDEGGPGLLAAGKQQDKAQGINQAPT